MNLYEQIEKDLQTRSFAELTEIANRTNLNVVTLYKLQQATGRDPRWSTVLKLQKALGIKDPERAGRRRSFVKM